MNVTSGVSPTKKTAKKEETAVTETFTFFTALGKVMKGVKLTRAEWNDEDSYMFMHEGYLCLNLKDGIHTFTVREADILANDWMVVNG